jgi:aspartyl-tRNA(Asn)/glutamyl-tRNA(Gln) amidotransferase subunit A
MHNNTLSAISTLLKEKKCSSVELTSHFINRIKALDPKLNSFISVFDEEELLKEASVADQWRAKGNATPLTGVPIALKDIFCTKGKKTTCASKMLSHYSSPYDAHIVAKFKQEKTIILGKTNMDEFAMGSSGENSYFKPTKNPWDLARVPGGSSSGSAVAVAARLAPSAIGTDTGGSIRQPAAFTGITGLKPTYGRVSRFGMIAFASSLDQAGPMAQTAEDCALLMNSMAGFDEKDSTSSEQPTENYAASLNDSLKGLRIGLPKQYFTDALDPGIHQQIKEAIKVYESLGATVKEIDLPHSNLAIATYYILAPAECSSNLSRFDGVRFGYRCENPTDLTDFYCRTRGEGFGEEVKRRILIGTYMLSSGYYDSYYLKAQKARHLVSNDFAEAFKEVDVILGPTTPTPAFKIGDKTEDPATMYLNDIYTINTNLAGLPGLSHPAGFVEGLPVGLQLIGNYFEEARLLNIAHCFQQATDWHQKIPNDYQ